MMKGEWSSRYARPSSLPHRAACNLRPENTIATWYVILDQEGLGRGGTWGDIEDLQMKGVVGKAPKHVMSRFDVAFFKRIFLRSRSPALWHWPVRWHSPAQPRRWFQESVRQRSTVGCLSGHRARSSQQRPAWRDYTAPSKALDASEPPTAKTRPRAAAGWCELRRIPGTKADARETDPKQPPGWPRTSKTPWFSTAAAPTRVEWCSGSGRSTLRPAAPRGSSTRARWGGVAWAARPAQRSGPEMCVPRGTTELPVSPPDSSCRIRDQCTEPPVCSTACRSGLVKWAAGTAGRTTGTPHWPPTAGRCRWCAARLVWLTSSLLLLRPPPCCTSDGFVLGRFPGSVWCS